MGTNKILVIVLCLITTNVSIGQRYIQIGVISGVGSTTFYERPAKSINFTDNFGNPIQNYKAIFIHKGYNLSTGIEASFHFKKFRLYVNENLVYITITKKSTKFKPELTQTFGDFENAIYTKGEDFKIYSTRIGISYYFFKKNNFSIGGRFGMGYYLGKYQTFYSVTEPRFGLTYTSPFYNGEMQGYFNGKFQNRFLINPGIEVVYKNKKFEFELIPNFEYLYFYNRNTESVLNKEYKGEFLSYNICFAIRYNIHNIN